MSKHRGDQAIDEADKIREAFAKAVNMTSAQIRAFLKTNESKAVGFVYPGEAESVGRQSAKKIVEILEGRRLDLPWQSKVVGYVRRHLAQKPNKTRSELRHTSWRYSLMNWGHDPIGLGHA